MSEYMSRQEYHESLDMDYMLHADDGPCPRCNGDHNWCQSVSDDEYGPISYLGIDEIIATNYTSNVLYCFCCSEIIPAEEISHKSSERVLGYCLPCSAKRCHDTTGKTHA